MRAGFKKKIVRVEILDPETQELTEDRLELEVPVAFSNHTVKLIVGEAIQKVFKGEGE